MNNELVRLDWIVLGGYMLVLLGIAWWVISKKNETSEEYFLAGRNIGWFVIGASIFASNIGSEHVVGLAGTGAESGVPLAHYELHAWIVLLLGWFFLPFYMRSNAFTMPEFLEKRFDGRSRWFLSIFSIAGYVLTKVSVTIYAGGIVVANLLNISFLSGAIVTVIVTGIYTVLGGMRAVVYTEAFQTVLILVGSSLITILGLQEIGGWSELRATVGSEHFNMWKPASDPQFPWTGLLFGGTIVGIWYWCTDQYIVQRTLAAKNIQVGRRGAIFGAFLKLAPIFIFLIPGIIAYGLKKKGLLSYDKSDEVFPAMVKHLLPAGLKGLVAGGLMAALMSSLASVFNSASTLFTVDIFKRLYPDTAEKKLVRIGKIATGFIVLLGMLWIPVMQKIGGGVLYQYLQNVQAYIAPPITAVFVIGILWKRMNGQAAIATLFYGLISATLRIVLELMKDSLSGFPLSFATINFSHFAIFNFLVCAAVAIVVSLATAPPNELQLAGLTISTLSPEQRQANRDSYSKLDVAISLLLAVIVISILIYFRG
ncbi:MAG: sodium/solute symporter [Saprospiraceae bacterium]|nr:sodium/solute symporter [Saprospiraceae bacterium]MBK7371109.1 sodium/solute symporter [Saprospiraceae bacterium]MBK7436391.1 sodium/solute symporter [Saprospiraceae bacterium]MBK8281180.1 sodium/solute symporter [Saprospiraceae bacterium]MBK9679937.1 sodium/solute symporter [Saprospiraceae bacterium]